MPTSYPEEVIQDFLAELESYIPRLKGLMDGLRPAEGRGGRLKEIRRLVRSIKGAALVMGISGLSQIASGWEETLNGVLDGRQRFNPDVEDEMRKTLEALGTFATGFVDGDLDEAKLAETAVSGLGTLGDAAEGRLPEEPESGSGDAAEIEAEPNHSCSSESARTILPGAGPGEIQQNDTVDEISNGLSSTGFDDFPDIEADVEADAEMDVEQVFASLGSGSNEDCRSMKRELLEGFYQEAEEHLQDLEKGLQSLESQIPEPCCITRSQREQLRQIRRSVHTLKGAASIVGIQEPAAWAHEVEDFLDWLYETASEISPETITELARSADLLAEYVNRPGMVKPEAEQDLKKRFAELMETASDRKPPARDDIEDPDLRELDADSGPEPPVFEKGSIRSAPDNHAASSGPTRTIRVDLSKIDSLAGMTGELVITLSAFDQRMKYLKSAIEELDLTRHRLRDAARELELGYEIKAIQQFGSLVGAAAAEGNPTPRSLHMEEFDTLEMDRYTEFNLIIRAINEAVVDVGAINAELISFSGDFDGYINRQRNLLGELQNDITRVRMTPMAIISGRLRRTVRETSDRLKKKVRLVIEGEGIELDRTVWEKLADPLMHMLRNAVDHGIESPEARLTAGKPETGVITVKAAYVGQHVSIRISDDGRGLDYETIRERMRAAGRIRHGLEVPEEELAAFVFHQGFSTRRNVTEISGRGVGLDVVKENIAGLQGTVRVAGSKPGQGTRFDILIPLTVGMLRAILFSVNGSVYAVPLREVREITRLEAQQWIHEPAPAVQLGEDIIPFYQLSESLARVDAAPAEPSITEHPVVMVVDTGSWRGAVAVDMLIGQREIVVKNVGTHLGHVRGVFGATISGDGKVVPILNLSELLDLEPADDLPPLPVERDLAGEKGFEILVVDDSVSVRQVISRLLESRGWKADTARDGVEALEKLPDSRPDLIILDVEMPRMNGYEFLSTVRAQAEYRNIPVIILTSRSAGKHRQKALNLGAQAYVVKPFENNAFLDLVERLATQAGR